MSNARPLVTIPVGVLVQRTKGTGPWNEFSWRPIGLLTGIPATPAWTQLSDDGVRAVFYAGNAQIELYRTETPYYCDNLRTDLPRLWVALEATEFGPPYRVITITADPAEGESLTETATLLVECVPMPAAIREHIASFISKHHIERSFVKRTRDRTDPEALAHRPPHSGKRS